MQFLVFWALIASAGLVLCDKAVWDLDQAPRRPLCAVQGDRFLRPFLITSQGSFSVPAQCGALCKSQRLCQSYSIEAGYCRLYALPARVPVLTNHRPGDLIFYDKFCETSTDICQVNGYRSSLSKEFFSSNRISDNNYNACLAICKQTAGCRSFSIQVETGGSCRLYKTALVKDFNPNTQRTNLFWDINCPRDITNPGPRLIKSAPPPLNDPPFEEDKVEPVSFPPAPNPTVVSSDSPPYTPAGPQVTPEDDDIFTSTYTYEQYELPPVDATGSPPVTTGIPQPTAIPTAPCMVQPGPQAQFSIINENFVPMVSRASNSVGPMLQPTAAPQSKDPILEFDNVDLPGFYFQEKSGVSNVYDMVYAGSTPQFVAMTKDSKIVLTNASTGANFVSGLVTTIFSSDCFGVIRITQGGTSYRWDTTMSTSSLTKGSNRNLKALPKVIPAVQDAKRYRKRNLELVQMLKKRSYTDGPAPKCPAQPPNLKPLFKQGYELDQGNFCDSLSDWWGLSPYDFDGSCAVQSLCYDQCPDMGWVSCNAIFGTMMYLSCLDAFESWWEVLSAIACAAQASYFIGVAATSKGRDLFYKAQKSMCRCFCTSPPDTCIYVNSDNFYCADIHGDDDSNCGNCGRQCGPKSKCRKGICGCPRDQCGTTCLDFRNNPNNCGACGNRCDPAYCVDGRCYKPQPGDCIPDQPVTNNNFESGFVNWTMSAYQGCTLGDNVQFSRTRYLSASNPTNGDPAVLVAMTRLPAQGCQAALIQKEVKMCPGFKYELEFAMGYVNQVGNDPVQSDADCVIRWLTGPPASANGNDGFQSSSDYKIGLSNPSYKTFGPWSVSVAEGQPGVTKRKKDLLVNLTAVISCSKSGGAARFILRDIELNQVGTTKARSVKVEDDPSKWFNQVGSSPAPRKVLNITEQLSSGYPGMDLGVVLFSSFVQENVTNG